MVFGIVFLFHSGSIRITAVYLCHMKLVFAQLTAPAKQSQKDSLF